jgi:hypothetical protein
MSDVTVFCVSPSGADDYDVAIETSMARALSLAATVLENILDECDVAEVMVYRDSITVAQLEEVDPIEPSDDKGKDRRITEQDLQIKERYAEIERLLTALTIEKWDRGLGPAALEALTSEDKIKIAERIERKHAERMEVER